MINYETDRLVLRNYHRNDANDLYDFLSTDFVAQYQNYGPFSMGCCIKRIENCLNDDRRWVVVLKENNKVIGCLEYSEGEYGSFNIGYELSEEYGKKGYATEACKVLVKHVFTVANARRICADMSEENTGSWKLAERLGFRREGHFIEDDVLYRKNADEDPVYLNSYYYAILRREWKCGEKLEKLKRKNTTL